MGLLSKFAVALALASAVTAVPRKYPHQIYTKGEAPKAVYFITNDISGNAVVALRVRRNGMLSEGSITETGGLGSAQMNGTTGTPFVPDALSSQSSLTVVGDKLVAVNAGSNTLSTFQIDEYDATRLTMVGEPVDTMGEFPVTVAGSEKLNQVCVGNTGGQAGIACFELSDEAGLVPLDEAQRTLGLNQTSPPMAPFNAIAQVLFNEDSSALVATVKGVPMTSNTGFLAYYPVVDGQVSRDEVRTSPNGTSVLFGSVFVPHHDENATSTADDDDDATSEKSTLVASDATFGAGIFEFGRDGRASTVALTTIPGQLASCWAVYSDLTEAVYITDFTARLFAIDPRTGEMTETVEALNGTRPSRGNGNGNGNSNGTNTGMHMDPSMEGASIGLLDATTVGRFLYALSPSRQGAAIAVFRLSERGPTRAIQTFRPYPDRAGVYSQGMAHF